MKLLRTMLHAGPVLAQAAHGILDISCIWCYFCFSFGESTKSPCVYMYMSMYR